MSEDDEELVQLPDGVGEALEKALNLFIDTIKPMLTDDQRGDLLTNGRHLAEQVLDEDPDDVLEPLLRLAIALWTVFQLQKIDDPDIGVGPGGN